MADVFGKAQLTDLLNQRKNDSTFVCTQNIEEILDEFSESTDRAEQIDQLVTAMASTGAHELGHLFGLQHWDSYGDASLPLADPNLGGDPADEQTGQIDIDISGGPGPQNDFILGTEGTGLDEAGREQERTFSQLSQVKLEFASDVAAIWPVQ